MPRTFPDIRPPQTAKHPKQDTRHGIKRTDDYAWLRADNWQEVFQNPARLDPEIRSHLEEENAYYTTMMADTEPLQKQLVEEMKGRIKQDDSSVPVKDDAYAYGVSYTTGGEQPRYFRTPRKGGRETLYLDGDKEAASKAYFSFGTVSYSPDHQKLLWCYDDTGSEFYTLKVRRFSDLQDTDDIILETGGDAVWDAASEGFFYTKLDANHRPDKVYYHRLGSDPRKDKLIYHEKDSGFYLSVDGSLLEDFIFINTQDHQTSETWIIPANAPLTKPRCLKKRKTGVEYSLESGGDQFFILTNKDGAKDFKIMITPVNAPQVKNWRDFIPHEAGRLIVDHHVYQDHIVWLERRNALPRIVIYNRKTQKTGAIDFNEEAYALGLQGAAEYKTGTIRFSYSSMTTPSELYDYQLDSGKRTLLKKQDIPSGHNSSDYITRRLMAPAPDGELVPVSLVYHKDTALDGSAPCLMHGYGAYGTSIPASFSTSILSLLNRGFIYAHAHIRGGEDKGFAWYEKGKHTYKTNTFSDYIAAGRYLVQHKYTAHDRLVAYGGSAGGMLMGAVANQAPQDYAGILALVPFVDVLTTMLDDSLPLTPGEWPEWGNPITSVEDYKLIASYSPYDNIHKQAYPPILALAGLTDPRVTYWEPAKWVAKLRDKKSDSNPVLLRTNMGAGHAGAPGRFSRLEETACIYAFTLKITGKA